MDRVCWLVTSAPCTLLASFDHFRFTPDIIANLLDIDDIFVAIALVVALLSVRRHIFQTMVSLSRRNASPLLLSSVFQLGVNLMLILLPSQSKSSKSKSSLDRSIDERITQFCSVTGLTYVLTALQL